MSDYDKWEKITRWDGLSAFASGEGQRELEEAADILAACGYADDAAQETLLLLLKVRQWAMYASAIEIRLVPVWRAINSYHAMQKGNDWLRDALAKYRDEAI